MTAAWRQGRRRADNHVAPDVSAGLLSHSAHEAASCVHSTTPTDHLDTWPQSLMLQVL
jgi:hypothetical protein